MSTEKFCQSCSMPLDSKAVLGTEKDGSASLEYCKFCYQHGAFVHPEMTLAGMEYRVRARMAKLDLPADLVNLAVGRLPFLKRWSGAAPRQNMGPVGAAPSDKDH
ncbi:zinc ribbon domain-containing protein [Flavitalea sp. BT771]|uniref:zinc ribbon domain-containing protein n=1 Tax=Flavitalea sp. BT771 TaxID=3063329 RepID=UPI0026E3A05E|nr:zinc ribbon domain-containing protein [Flavitalea sp. BT771]MDO6432848.1 zinc ribbon domain-containing protein [Flavitalea sp. BT771]MDV6221876.1 zinc ribbon domain-containing protein [Flavitalea sp. BT771]